MPAQEWVVEQWPSSATIIAVRSHGVREGKPQDETRYYVTSLRAGAKALWRTRSSVQPWQQLVRCSPWAISPWCS